MNPGLWIFIYNEWEKKWSMLSVNSLQTHLTFLHNNVIDMFRNATQTKCLGDRFALYPNHFISEVKAKLSNMFGTIDRCTVQCCLAQGYV